METRFVELLFEYLDRYSVLPELFALLGPDKMLEFLEVFGGVTVKFPPRKAIALVVRDFEMYKALQGLEGREKSDTAKRLAEQHGVSASSVLKTYQRVAEFMEKRYGNGYNGQGYSQGNVRRINHSAQGVGAGLCGAPESGAD